LKKLESTVLQYKNPQFWKATISGFFNVENEKRGKYKKFCWGCAKTVGVKMQFRRLLYSDVFSQIPHLFPLNGRWRLMRNVHENIADALDRPGLFDDGGQGFAL